MNDDKLKAAISVSEMAELVGLSRGRFYELMREGIFCSPIFDINTRRPFFPEKFQRKNLKIRETNMGANGRMVLFYSTKAFSTTAPIKNQQPKGSRSKQAPQKQTHYANLLDDLKALGLEDLKDSQVGAAVSHCFPNGIKDAEESEVLRAVYRCLKHQNSSDNVG